MQQIKSLQSRRVEKREHHLLQFLHRRAYLALSRKTESALIPKQNGHSTERPAVSDRSRELGKAGHCNREMLCVCSLLPPLNVNDGTFEKRLEKIPQER